MRKRHKCAIFKLYTNSFCRQRAGVRSFDESYFPANHGSAFSCKQPPHFPALSILTILLDKCQTKNFEDINILIKAETFLQKSCVAPRLSEVEMGSANSLHVRA